MVIENHLSKTRIRDFQNTVWDYYYDNARALSWREVEDGIIDPYYVLVSEIMLQQTGVSRVKIKFEEFTRAFPDIRALAESSLQDVLMVWNGLGYNRRAKYLHEIAKSLYSKPFPKTVEELVKLKGIGKNTAAAILVYAYNQRHVFIETNIRTVFIHHFFPQDESVSDKDIEQAVRITLPDESSREWYWAIMDYGTYLKKNGSGHLQRAKTYKKQSRFKGSFREVRSLILKTLLRDGMLTKEGLITKVEDTRVDEALIELVRDGLVATEGDYYKVAT